MGGDGEKREGGEERRGEGRRGEAIMSEAAKEINQKKQKLRGRVRVRRRVRGRFILSIKKQIYSTALHIIILLSVRIAMMTVMESR